MKIKVNLRNIYRRLRLVVKSFLFLPPKVKIIANGKTAYLSTRGFPTANIALWLKWKGKLVNNILFYEEEERSLIEPILQRSKSFWDIGAQIGFYSIVAALHGVKKILAVDIDKRYCKEILKHSAHNHLAIRTANLATGISGTTVQFENYGATTNQSAISLDELSRIYGQPDLIKMDIDGGELATLQGAPILLSKPDAPILFLEFLDQHSDTNELNRILTQYGYSMIKRSGNNVLWKKQ